MSMSRVISTAPRSNGHKHKRSRRPKTMGRGNNWTEPKRPDDAEVTSRSDLLTKYEGQIDTTPTSRDGGWINDNVERATIHLARAAKTYATRYKDGTEANNPIVEPPRK